MIEAAEANVEIKNPMLLTYSDIILENLTYAEFCLSTYSANFKRFTDKTFKLDRVFEVTNFLS